MLAGGIFPIAQALETCEEPIRRFRGGPGRRPGATVIAVFFRQTVKDVTGGFVSAESERTLAQVKGDQIHVKVAVKNESLFPVGSVAFHHAYRRVPDGPSMEGIADVVGAAYIEPDRLFIVDRIESGQTAEFSFTILLNGFLGSGITQTALKLNDFMVLDPGSRYPRRYPETSYSRHRTTIDKVGIGGKEVSCFSADPVVLEPGRPVARVIPGVPAALPPRSVITGPKRTARTTDPERVSIRFEKQVSRLSPRPGERVLITLTVRNRGIDTLRDILVDDRFDTTELLPVEDGGGLVTGKGIQWLIEELASGEEWQQRYSVRIADNAMRGSHILSTLSLFGEQLLDVPVSRLTYSQDLVVADGAAQESPSTVLMPQTGWSGSGFVWLTLQVIAGVLIGAFLFGYSLRAVWRKVIRWCC